MNHPNDERAGQLSEAGLENVVRYYGILRRIHARLVIEGYFLSDGKTWNIFKIAEPPAYNPKDYKLEDYEPCEA